MPFSPCFEKPSRFTKNVIYMLNLQQKIYQMLVNVIYKKNGASTAQYRQLTSFPNSRTELVKFPKVLNLRPASYTFSFLRWCSPFPWLQSSSLGVKSRIAPLRVTNVFGRESCPSSKTKLPVDLADLLHGVDGLSNWGNRGPIGDWWQIRKALL